MHVVTHAACQLQLWWVSAFAVTMTSNVNYKDGRHHSYCCRQSCCSLIRNGLPTLLVRRLMQGLSFLGCGLSVLPLALNPNIGLMPAVWCLTANLTCYSLSYGGFQSYLQDVAGKDAGVVQGLTNSASTIMGIFGSLLTGWVVEATGT
eukprot:GHUV01045207.1.p1 GENE.GHUV01045207.1~~GHUV01045207.1.p1  ORF type:complete len:148 (-),score=10.95 GHUV01045207.1:42-485(-)